MQVSKKSLALNAGKALFESLLCNADKFPISFTYGTEKYVSLGKPSCISRTLAETPSGAELNAVWQLDESLSIRLLARYNAEYGQSEYNVYFENNSSVPSKVLSGICALDTAFSGDTPLLRGILGDHQNCYAPYETNLAMQDAYLESTGGRATHVAFPYFDLVHGDGGTLIALGWAGIWNALFTKTAEGVKSVIRSNPSLNTVLLPGESVSTGLIVLLPYNGRNQNDAMNLWREWFIRCSMPRANASGSDITPFSTSNYAGDTGLPNSDGSISEQYFTWKPTLDKILAEDVAPDFRWIDAGWYFDPAGNTV